MIYAVVAAGLGAIRWIYPERSLDDTGWRAWLDAGFALGLLALVVVLAAAIGQKALTTLKLTGLTSLEKWVFRLAAGMGVLAYGVLGLGLTGYLRPGFILLWLGIAVVISWQNISGIIEKIPQGISQAGGAWRSLDWQKKGFLVLAGLSLLLSSLQALAPAWDYDGLMYHLQAPRLFLQTGRIDLLPDLLQANGPMTQEMLYTVGLAFGSDVFAKLVHLSFAVLLVAAVFCMGQRTLGKAGGWLPAAVILGIPIFPIWGSLAYADMGLAVYIFLAVYALTVWQKTLSSGWLVLAGMMTGWALGSKYLAVGMLAAIGLGLLWASRRESGAVILRRSLVFGFPAALIAAPWFLKNAVLGGNPVYPMFFGGAAWPADRLELLNYYLMDSFGSGRGFWDYVTLPWNLYANNIYFATFVSSIEYPSFLFPLALFFPFLRDRKGLGLVGGITLMGFGIWAMGSQQTRFLLSLFAPLSVLTGGVLLGLAGQLRSGLWRRALGSGVLGGFMLVTVIYQGLFFAQINPLPVVAGGESKEDFLTRTVYDYAALRFIQEELPPDARVMMLWDGQGYYCDHRCLPDAEQSQWVGLARRAEFEVGGAAKLLGAGEVSHLLLSLEGLSFFLQHDPSGLHQAAWAFLGDDFLDVCTREIYNDGKMILYALTCD